MKHNVLLYCRVPFDNHFFYYTKEVQTTINTTRKIIIFSFYTSNIENYIQCSVWYPSGYNGRNLEEENKDNGANG